MSLFNRPKVLYPVIVKGTIIAPLIRLESLKGPEIVLPRSDFPQIFRNFGPIDRNGVTYFVCHLQKYATQFSLQYNPFIYHWCKGWRAQQKDAQGNWIAGSERLLYWRTPGWRWQQPDALSEWTPWIFSKGRVPGLHLD